MVIICILTMYQIQTNKGLGSVGEGQEQEPAGGHKQWVEGKHKHRRQQQVAAAGAGECRQRMRTRAGRQTRTADNGVLGARRVWRLFGVVWLFP